MKRLFRILPAIFALASGAFARADLAIPSVDVREIIEIEQEAPSGRITPYLPLILIVALLIVTALLVRHFTKKK